jgi:hypothetical protein
MSELKSGESIDFQIGDKTLTIEPVPYGNIKKIIRLAFAVSKDIESGGLKSVPEMIDKNLYEILPLLFAKDRYPFLTPEWIENTMSVPQIRKIIEAAIVSNGLKDFFDKGMGTVTGTGKPVPTLPTPPAKDGSITSVDSPTAGVPKT